jgi:mono/diheme cytochrome c family protein
MVVSIKSTYPDYLGGLSMNAYRLFVSFISYLLFSYGSMFAQSSPAADLTANPVFQKNCAKCHGKTAEGRHFGGPSLISDKTSKASSDELRHVISNGKGRMPKYTGKLSPEEIDTLVAEIKGMNKK